MARGQAHIGKRIFSNLANPLIKDHILDAAASGERHFADDLQAVGQDQTPAQTAVFECVRPDENDTLRQIDLRQRTAAKRAVSDVRDARGEIDPAQLL